MLAPLTPEQQQWVDATLNAMTLPQAVAQLLCVSSPRFTTDGRLDLIQKIPLGALTVCNAPSGEIRKQL